MFTRNDIEPVKKRINLSTPTMHGEELVYITEAYETNWMSTVGMNIVEIEKLFIDKIGCKYAVALSSGTSALHLSVKLAGVKPNDIVFCSDLTFSATANPISYEGGSQIFIDSERDTWNMDPTALEKAFEIYPNAKVVVVVNLYGIPAKLDKIREICENHNAILIEDAAESLGAKYKGKMTGTFGNYNIISFNGNKIITGSSGGMLLTDNLEAADLAKKWSTQSKENAPWYQHVDLGYNYRMSNIIAGVVRGQFSYLDEHLEKKKAIYTKYMEGLKGIPIQMNPYLGYSEPSFWLSCILIDEEAMCQQKRSNHESKYYPESGKSCPTEIMETLGKLNIESRPIWKPMHLQPIFIMKDLVTNNGNILDMKHSSSHKRRISVGEDIFDRGLCLPSDIKMTEDEQNKVIDIIRSCFE